MSTTTLTLKTKKKKKKKKKGGGAIVVPAPVTPLPPPPTVALEVVHPTVRYDQLKTIDGVLVAQQDLGLYEGLIPVFVETVEDPIIRWKGAKISAVLWGQIVSFMRWTFDKYNSEAQLRLYYNEVTHIWDVAVFPQYVGTGMSSDEIKDHEGREEVFGDFDSALGWREAGTLHHHCRCSAFQSGIDFADERDKNGLHITLGDMEDKVCHGFHARSSFRKIMYEIIPEEWVEAAFLPPDTNVSWSKTLRVATSTVDFPEKWAKFLIIKPVPVIKTYGSPASGGIGYGAYYHNDGFSFESGERYNPGNEHEGFRSKVEEMDGEDDNSSFDTLGTSREVELTLQDVRTEELAYVLRTTEELDNKFSLPVFQLCAEDYLDYQDQLDEIKRSLYVLQSTYALTDDELMKDVATLVSESQESESDRTFFLSQESDILELFDKEGSTALRELKEKLLHDNTETTPVSTDGVSSVSEGSPDV